MKTGKSPGTDNICIELLKTDVITAGNVFTDLLSDIWTTNEIPRDWNKGLIVKIPKKGDFQNWRGITLLSMPSKIFCRVLLNRIEGAIDVNLRQEQAGFRRGKGCKDQIFSLRNIIEQSTEWNAPLYIGFIDFKKAFDSIHHETLWKILRHYGLPQKIVGLISVLYKRFECSVLMDSAQTDYFPVKSGVCQGCILSPILFNIALDYIMRQITQHRGPDLPFFWHAVHADPLDGWRCCSQKRVSVETNSGPTTLNKKVWICDICHKQIYVRKQISIRCNRIEHWVHLRCAGIRQAQYTDTWTCHLHRESRLTPHTAPPHRSRPLSKPPTHSPPTPTKTQTHVQHSPCPQRIGKAQTLFYHPLTPLSTHTAPSQTHTHVTHSTNTSHKHVTCTRQNT